MSILRNNLNTPNKNPRTITRWILTEQKKHPNAKGDLSIILNSLTVAIKIISGCAQGAGVFHQLNASLKRQMQAQATQQIEHKSDPELVRRESIIEKKRRIDEYAQEVLINSVKWSGKVAMILTQQTKNVIKIEECEDPKYALVFDPLDGAQNIDANVSVGSIFGIVRIKDASNMSERDLLQPGSQLVCAGYALYGDATLIVMTFGQQVNGFTLDPTIGEFVMTHSNIKIPRKGNIYSVNEGNHEQWSKPVTEYVTKCKKTTKDRVAMKLRYVGSMVADVHRTLLYGGIFFYPACNKYPNGKLRLLYEVNPIAFIVKTAGGKATNGKKDVLTIVPTEIHQKSPIYVGSPDDVDELVAIFKQFA